MSSPSGTNPSTPITTTPGGVGPGNRNRQVAANFEFAKEVDEHNAPYSWDGEAPFRLRLWPAPKDSPKDWSIARVPQSMKPGTGILDIPEGESTKHRSVRQGYNQIPAPNSVLRGGSAMCNNCASASAAGGKCFVGCITASEMPGVSCAECVCRGSKRCSVSLTEVSKESKLREANEVAESYKDLKGLLKDMTIWKSQNIEYPPPMIQLKITTVINNLAETVSRMDEQVAFDNGIETIALPRPTLVSTPQAERTLPSIALGTFKRANPFTDETEANRRGAALSRWRSAFVKWEKEKKKAKEEGKQFDKPAPVRETYLLDDPPSPTLNANAGASSNAGNDGNGGD
ncbi:uncharacterized protein L201_005388 [Kwoniella dendrophila CBS 6074]|uniref:Uncharacterized protein n=1 Tax=Kwoniella dendrophila CBS 6074 TaxID=1295534 RepID=A0AAX4K065_9TREE